MTPDICPRIMNVLRNLNWNSPISVRAERTISGVVEGRRREPAHVANRRTITSKAHLIISSKLTWPSSVQENNYTFSLPIEHTRTFSSQRRVSSSTPPQACPDGSFGAAGQAFFVTVSGTDPSIQGCTREYALQMRQISFTLVDTGEGQRLYNASFGIKL